MKKIIFAIILVVAVTASGPAFAQPMGEGMGEGKMTGKGMGGQKKMGKMMGPMMKTQMIATEDGGVVILQGKKLIKYDQDLNLVKEVEIPCDMKDGPMGMMPPEGMDEPMEMDQ